MDECWQLLFRSQAHSQADDVAEHPSMHALGQAGAHHAGARALEIGLQSLDVVEDRDHG